MALTLVFDLDGTLAETAPDLIDALNHVLAGDGVAPVPFEAARTMVGAGARALIERGYAFAGRPLTKERLDAQFQLFLDFYNAHIADKSALFPGALACLERCRAEGWRLAVCTNKLEYSSKLLLEKLGALDQFAFVCGQDTFGVAKPDPRPLIETVARAGGDLASAVMIGDSVTDIRTARAAGIPVVAVDFGYTDIPVRELGPDRVISHFDALDEAVRALT
jgi:phosphoglycolate phosphatase